MSAPATSEPRTAGFAPPPPRGRASRWADLALGMRLAFGGGRDGLLRVGMTALGVALGVGMLLIAASTTHALDGYHQRGAARSTVHAADQEHGTDRTALVYLGQERYHDHSIGGMLLKADGTHPPVPPGLKTFPKPGEIVVSPGLARLLDSSEGKDLRPRFARYHRAGQQIGPAGLQGPNELYYYAGEPKLPENTETSLMHPMRDARFGVPYDGHQLPVFLTVLIVVAVVVMLVPIAVFIGTASRFGGEQRDRRLAALRLAGGDRAQVARVAAGESLAGAASGVVLGVLVFFGLRALAPHVTLFGQSVFSSDLTPDPLLAVLVVVAVPLVAIGATLLAMRRVAVEPLGVVRRGLPARRRMWWRVLVPVVGLLLLVYSARSGSGSLNVTVTASGTVLLLVGITAVLPWVVDLAVRRAGGGPLSWQLAVRRLQIAGEGSARIVNGIAVAVAGAIALQMLFAVGNTAYVQDTGHDTQKIQAVANVPLRNGDVAHTDAVTRKFAAARGVKQAVGAAEYALEGPGKDQYDELTVGSCATLAKRARIGTCHDGDVFAERGPDGLAGKTPRISYSGDDHGTPWTVPRTTKPLHTAGVHDTMDATGVLATPGALARVHLPAANVRVYLSLDKHDRDAIERARNTGAALGPQVAVDSIETQTTDDDYRQIRTAVMVGVTVTLLLVGASMLISTAEQLRDRKRVLSVLVAFGTKRSVLARSVLWQTAIPMLLSTVLAVVTGLVLGFVLVKIGERDLSMPPWAQIAEMAGIGAGVVLLVTLATVPLLMRLMRPEGLRSE